MITPQFILQATFFVVNSFSLAFLVWFVCRICQRAEKKIDQAIAHIEHISDRNDAVYINQLETLKRDLASQERFEEAGMIDKAIREEVKRFKKKETKDEYKIS